jgi:hypothetical protein
MNIGDKNIGGKGYTILSNAQTGKIAMMVTYLRAKINLYFRSLNL